MALLFTKKKKAIPHSEKEWRRVSISAQLKNDVKRLEKIKDKIIAQLQESSPNQS